MLRDGDEREVAERWAIVAPAEALGRIGISPVGAEVDAKARILGVIEFASACTFCVLRNTKPSRRVESVGVDEDQPELAQQIGVLERRQRRIGLGHEERIGRRQRGNQRGINGEVVGLDVARPARPSVARRTFRSGRAGGLRRPTLAKSASRVAAAWDRTRAPRSRRRRSGPDDAAAA